MGAVHAVVLTQKKRQWGRSRPFARHRGRGSGGGTGRCAQTEEEAVVAVQAVVHDTEEGVVVVDLNHSRSLHARHRKGMLDQVMQTEDMDNQVFLQRIKERLDRSGQLRHRAS